MNDTTSPQTPEGGTQVPPQQPSAGPTPPPYAPPAPMLESQARTIAMLVHILAAAALILSAGTLAFVVPLVMWLIYRERSALIDFHGRQNLNLQLTSLVVFAGGILIGVFTLGVGLIFTVPLMIVYAIYVIVISIIAGVRANRGEYFPIPVTIPFIR
ncbi:DUF4870 domain-containing protein [Demequina mangrovi]|uniref:Tic20 family protein n=1 Tax=Demequina mangrovi TaxID=1043493 RepID=A0A1H6UV77_9MICO|nr:DUF4870 domain-containing protein [Demequina mangrovi]SEI96141.1 hypothetical protein SAMN05421637_0558 [Demequina mangrovi]